MCLKKTCCQLRSYTTVIAFLTGIMKKKKEKKKKKIIKASIIKRPYALQLRIYNCKFLMLFSPSIKQFLNTHSILSGCFGSIQFPLRNGM